MAKCMAVGETIKGSVTSLDGFYWNCTFTGGDSIVKIHSAKNCTFDDLLHLEVNNAINCQIKSGDEIKPMNGSISYTWGKRKYSDSYSHNNIIRRVVVGRKSEAINLEPISKFENKNDTINLEPISKSENKSDTINLQPISKSENETIKTVIAKNDKFTNDTMKHYQIDNTNYFVDETALCIVANKRL